MLMLRILVHRLGGVRGGVAAAARAAFALEGVLEIASPALAIRHDHLPREAALAVLATVALLLLRRCCGRFLLLRHHLRRQLLHVPRRHAATVAAAPRAKSREVAEPRVPARLDVHVDGRVAARVLHDGQRVGAGRVGVEEGGLEGVDFSDVPLVAGAGVAANNGERKGREGFVVGGRWERRVVCCVFRPGGRRARRGCGGGEGGVVCWREVE